MITETIGTKLMDTIGTIVPIYLDEAEVDEYPFASYDLTVTPSYDKDGINKLVGDVKIYVISKDFEQARSLSNDVIEAVESGMNDGQYVAVRRTSTEKCYEGIWDIETDYTIIQKS